MDKTKTTKFNGRVDDETLTEVSKFARDMWEQEFTNARKLFSTAEPDKAKDRDQLVRHKRNMLCLLKELAQHRSGAVHPMGRNTTEEKSAAQRWLDAADAELQKGANVNVQSDEDE